MAMIKTMRYEVLLVFLSIPFQNFKSNFDNVLRQVQGREFMPITASYTITEILIMCIPRGPYLHHDFSKLHGR